jgi:hypothetical protein
MRIGRNSRGQILPLDEQLERVGDNGFTLAERIYAIADDSRCTELGNEKYFSIRTQDRTPPSNRVLETLRYLTSQRSSISDKYKLDYIDAEAKSCMATIATVQVISVTESATNSDAQKYRAILEPKRTDACKSVVTAEFTIPFNVDRVEVTLWSVPKAEFDCLRYECLRDSN